MELRAARASRPDKAGRLEHVEVLGDGLPAASEPMARKKPMADLEERLAVAIGELVEDRPPCPVGQGLEQKVVHLPG